MLPRPHAEEAPNHERWLVSYADFITLLFATFTVLYAISSVDAGKAASVSRSVKEALGLPGEKGDGHDLMPPPIPPPVVDTHHWVSGRDLVMADIGAILMLKDLKGFIEINDLSDEVDVDLTDRGVVITLSEAGFFDSGSASLKPTGYGMFAQLAMVLSRHQSELRVEGHTDDRPTRGRKFSSNWELSSARAVGIVETLIDDFGYKAERLAATGLGSHRPLASNDTETGRAHNRRVELVVVSHSTTDAQLRP